MIKSRCYITSYGLRSLLIGTIALMLLPGRGLYVNNANDAFSADGIAEL